MRDLIPWARSRTPARYEEPSPFLSLHRDRNRLFDDVFRNFGLIGEFAPRGLAWPSVEVSDHDKEIRVTAEVAGLEEGDIEIDIESGVLTLRGEKRTEIEDKDRRYTERSYGRFERKIALPAEVDEDRARATFKNGVLTVTLPKTERARQNAKRIPVQST